MRTFFIALTLCILSGAAFAEPQKAIDHATKLIGKSLPPTTIKKMKDTIPVAAISDIGSGSKVYIIGKRGKKRIANIGDPVFNNETVSVVGEKSAEVIMFASDRDYIVEPSQDTQFASSIDDALKKFPKQRRSYLRSIFEWTAEKITRKSKSEEMPTQYITLGIRG